MQESCIFTFTKKLRPDNPSLAMGKFGHGIQVKSNDTWRELPKVLSLKKQSLFLPFTAESTKMPGAYSEMTSDISR